MVKSFRFETEATVNAAVDQCWAVLSDPKTHRAKWEPGCKDVRIVGRSGMFLVVEVERQLPGGPSIRRKLKGALHPVGRIDWTVEEGFEKGSKIWDVIQPVGDENKSRVVFSGEVLPETGLGLAAAFSRSAAARAYAERVKPDLEAFKRYVEGLPPLAQGEGWAYINLE
ncbi:MAG TPA: SRPBCC family protein [Candidatus Thermoplasmatota archaeon]|nr:SRPBCC family protein [Candidatus Thermoplasmatota archaeon]